MARERPFGPWLAGAAVILSLLVLAPTSAMADSSIEGDAFALGPKAGWYVMGGLTTGGSFGSNGAGGFVGGELSMVRLKQRRWLGLYSDLFYDFAQDRAVLTAGPEFGKGFFGLDGGVGVRFGEQTELGGQARLLFSAGIFSLYGRYGVWPGDTLEHTGQVGILLKMPMIYWGG